MPVITDRSSSPESVPDKEAISLSDQVAAGSTQTLTYKVPEEATVERFAVRIYVGAELDLEIDPYIKTDGNEPNRTLIDLVGKQYIDGDDDRYEFDLSRSIPDSAEIVLEATNNDGSNAYDYRANLEIDYASGASRFLGGIL